MSDSESSRMAPRILTMIRGSHDRTGTQGACDWFHHAVGSALGACVDFALPPACPICEEPLTAGPERQFGCTRCRGRIPRTFGCCPRCGAPLGPNLVVRDRCHHCRRQPLAVEATFALGEYRDVVREAILKAKYSAGGPASAWLADRLWEHRGEELRELPIQVVTAVPHHWSRRLIRRHDAAESVGRRLAWRLKVPFRTSILVKTRRTPLQTDLTPTERRRNLRSAFRGRRCGHRPRILLCDDVMTTGTTVHRAAGALRQAGAARLWAAVIARGLGQSGSAVDRATSGR